MRQFLERLGMTGLITTVGIWGCVALVLGVPFVVDFLNGAFFTVFASPLPLAGLSCPLSLSAGETKTITATISNLPDRERTYLVQMEQPPINVSYASNELCHQEITIQSGGEKTASCLVRLIDLDKSGWREESWYMHVEAITPPNADYISFDPEHMFAADCIIRSPNSFRSALGYSTSITLAALAIILWGAYLWSKVKWLDRILIFLFSFIVYGLAWLINVTIWAGLSNLYLGFMIVGGLLLVMYLVL
ncbi:MAG: hypothetical protein JXB07_00795 [Anaerolineae bacterium]|nr:hypothetical protein [Anaerolineae bacterium]